MVYRSARFGRLSRRVRRIFGAARPADYRAATPATVTAAASSIKPQRTSGHPVRSARACRARWPANAPASAAAAPGRTPDRPATVWPARLLRVLDVNPRPVDLNGASKHQVFLLSRAVDDGWSGTAKDAFQGISHLDARGVSTLPLRTSRSTLPRGASGSLGFDNAALVRRVGRSSRIASEANGGGARGDGKGRRAPFSSLDGGRQVAVAVFWATGVACRRSCRPLRSCAGCGR